ncbi:Rho GTPase activation protein [Pisolithus marmoratus]|nr:Rho GTPase activation protein [Pisolithus marmoratus]
MPPSLRQRLAALSLAPSFPSTPLGTAGPNSLTGSRKSFVPPWKRGSSHVAGNEPGEKERVKELMGKVIFQAGVDYETRPMVIMCASALPDPQAVSYDSLLSCIMSYLDLYVESDYTVVFFAAGAKHIPSWNWIWRAYRSLSRKYRKNLKRLYIVHSSFFSKMLFSLAGAVISPKFFRKIVYINTLSDLAHHVPLTQIDITAEVYKENLKYEKEVTMPIPIRASLFGVPLEELMGYDGEKDSIPRVVKDAIQYIRESGLNEEGLFRRSPSSSLLKQVQEAYDRGQVVSLPTFDDPHLASVLLKKYLRDLPDPVFPETIYPIIRQCPMPSEDPTDMSTIIYIRDTLFPQLKPCVYILLSHILQLLHEVSLHSASNRMDARNLAIVICPNLVKGSNPLKDVTICAVPGDSTHENNFAPPVSDASQAASFGSPVSNGSASEGKTTLGAILVLCIQRYYEIFDEVQDRSEPVRPSPRRFSRSVSPPAPSSPSAISTFGSKASRPLSLSMDDEDSVDDAMLVMPIGPNANTASPLSAGEDSAKDVPSNGMTTFPYQPRQRKVVLGGEE